MDSKCTNYSKKSICYRVKRNLFVNSEINIIGKTIEYIVKNPFHMDIFRIYLRNRGFINAKTKLGELILINEVLRDISSLRDEETKNKFLKCCPTYALELKVLDDLNEYDTLKTEINLRNTLKCMQKTLIFEIENTIAFKQFKRLLVQRNEHILAIMRSICDSKREQRRIHADLMTNKNQKTITSCLRKVFTSCFK